MRHSAKPIFPKWFVVSLASAVLLSLIWAMNGQDSTAQSIDRGEAVVTRALTFHDEAEGYVSVRDATTQEEVLRVAPGEGGFLRSVMRGLASNRKPFEIGPETPFNVIIWENGLVSLADPATQRQIELSAFGKDQVTSFVQLIFPNQAART